MQYMPDVSEEFLYKINKKRHGAQVNQDITNASIDAGVVAVAYSSYPSGVHIKSDEASTIAKENDLKCGKSLEISKQHCIAAVKELEKEPPKLEQALFKYQRSIATSPYPSEDDADENNSINLALAFGGRSAVQHKMTRYEECLSDIEQAMSFCYPEDKKYELLKRKGDCFRAMNKVEEAIESYEKVYESLHESACNAKARKKIRQQLKKHIEWLKSVRLNVKEPSESKPKLRQPPVKCGGDNEKVTSAAACIEVKVDDTWGRHFKSTKYIRPGEVLIIEKPFVSLLHTNKYHSHCYHCLKKYDAMIPCKTCNVVMFCSASCRDSSWTASHELECPILYYLFHTNTGVILPMLGILRMLIVAINKCNGLHGLYQLAQEIENNEQTIEGFNKDEKYVSSDCYAVHFLLGSLTGLEEEQMQTFALQSSVVLKSIEKRSQLLDVKSGIPGDPNYRRFVGTLLFQYKCIFSTNYKFILDFGPPNRNLNAFGTNQIVGVGIYPTVALLNHSCIPNALVCARGDTFVVYSCLPIAEGDQIFVCYEWLQHYYVMKTRFERHTLPHYRSFTCKCKYSRNELPKSEKSMTLFCLECGSRLPKKDGIVTCSSCKKACSIQGMRTGLHNLIRHLYHLKETSHDEMNLPAISALIAKLSESAELTYDILSVAYHVMLSTCGQAGIYYLE